MCLHLRYLMFCPHGKISDKPLSELPSLGDQKPQVFHNEDRIDQESMIILQLTDMPPSEKLCFL